MERAMRIAICDDEHQQAQYIKMLVGRWAGESGTKADIEMYGSAEDFKAAREGGKKHDCLLLDIQMGGQDGIGLAREIRRHDQKLSIVFVTGHTDYMSQGYDVSALHYLVKPIDEGKLFEVLDKAAKNLAKEPEFLTLAINREEIFIPLCEIVHIEASLHHIVVNTVAGQHKAKMPLAAIENRLGDGFFKCTRSFIVGLRYVRRISKSEVILTDGVSVPLGRGLYKDINKAFIKYF